MPRNTKGSLPRYLGPDHLTDDMTQAIGVLSATLKVTGIACASHTHLDISGFGSPANLQATAVYLVGSVAQCIHSDLQIRDALFDDATRNHDLIADVIGVIGDATADDQFKTMSRDPWLWEAISHLVVHLATATAGFHPSGQVLAKPQVKYDVNDHGLDLIAIYDSGELGITAGESKAYLDNPTRGITDAANRLREVDESLRDVDLRATVNQLRSALTPAQSARIGGAFWRNERTYYPFICCDHASAIDWTRNRKSLRELNIPVSKKLLVPLSVPQARTVFDSLCESMRRYASGNAVP